MLNKLNSMMNNTESELRKEVIAIALDMIDDNAADEEVIGTLQDISLHGCASGIVGALIYNSDCKEFFIRHMEEIFDLYNQARDEGWDPADSYDTDATILSWFAFEVVINEVLDELLYA